MKTKEIELKITLPQHELDRLEQWLHCYAIFIKEEQLRDYSFDDSDNNLYHNNKTLRVRYTTDKCFLGYKQAHHDEKTEERIFCDEFETTVANGDSVQQILKALGYSVVVIIEKKRRTYSYQDIEIMLDNVIGLGLFVELELVSEIHDVRVGLLRLYKLLQHIGITSFEVRKRGYTSMMRSL